MMTIKLTKPRFLWHYWHSEPSNFSDVEGCLVHYRMFSSIPGPYPLDPIAGTAVIITTVSKKGTFRPWWWECKPLQLLWKTIWRFLKKLKIELPYDPVIRLLGIYPDKMTIRKDTCTPMFIAALFTKVKMWRQPKCPSTDDWFKNISHTHTNITQPWKIERTIATCSNIDGPRDYHTKQSQTERIKIMSLICGI